MSLHENHIFCYDMYHFFVFSFVKNCPISARQTSICKKKSIVNTMEIIITQLDSNESNSYFFFSFITDSDTFPDCSHRTWSSVNFKQYAYRFSAKEGRLFSFFLVVCFLTKFHARSLHLLWLLLLRLFALRFPWNFKQHAKLQMRRDVCLFLFFHKFLYFPRDYITLFVLLNNLRIFSNHESKVRSITHLKLMKSFRWIVQTEPLKMNKWRRQRNNKKRVKLERIKEQNIATRFISFLTELILPTFSLLFSQTWRI